MPTHETGGVEPSPEQTGPATGTAWPTQEHSWVLQQLHHLAEDVGGLKEAVNTLKESVADQRKTLNWIKYTVFTATGALLVIGYLVDKRFDQIFEALAVK